MEYVGGGTLQELLKSDCAKPRWWTPTRQVITIAEIVKGMKFIHSQEFIHRDLKPTNILIDDERDVRIGDFGTCRVYEMDVTMTNVGTPLYMAPEMWNGCTDYDEKKADVYSFGIILYEIVTGNGIFSNEGNKGRLLLDMQGGKRPDIPEDVFPFTREMITACWSHEASKRPDFKKIWKSLRDNEFKMMNGINLHSVKASISVIEAQERDLGIESD
jgi:serine/threonine protein kinase